jgi:hypothetical protein
LYGGFSQISLFSFQNVGGGTPPLMKLDGSLSRAEDDLVSERYIQIDSNMEVSGIWKREA